MRVNFFVLPVLVFKMCTNKFSLFNAALRFVWFRVKRHLDAAGSAATPLDEVRSSVPTISKRPSLCPSCSNQIRMIAIICVCEILPLQRR